MAETLFPNGGAGYIGFQRPETAGTEYATREFQINMIRNRMWTATLVQIMACTNAGGLSPAGEVDILPLVNQVDGLGNSVPHETIYGCPYFRLIGGANAVIMDPQVGDIGIALFAACDISNVISTQAQANPASGRRYDPADGLYIGGVLNGTPSQFIRFYDGGITITTPGAITVNAASAVVNTSGNTTVNAAAMTINAPTTINGTLLVTGAITADSTVTAAGEGTFNGVHTVSDHTHGGVMPGGAFTATPTG